MNWRAFQFGFIAGTILAAYSQYSGATGFRTASDLVAGGLIMGVVVEAAWFAVCLQARVHRRS